MGVWSRAVVGSLQAVNPKLAPLNSGVSFSSVGLFHFNSGLADIGRGMGQRNFLCIGCLFDSSAPISLPSQVSLRWFH